jgi:dTDP-4-dehydrorhamnose 3,5-epimerase
MELEQTSIEGLYIIRLRKFEDERGLFYESFNQRQFNELILGRSSFAQLSFVQDNISVSHKNVLRGLHFQTGEYAQGKLVQVLNGMVLDVAVDIREGSPTFGEYESVMLSGGDDKLFWIPPGFAHGFLSLADNTHFHYKCTNYYNKESEGGIIWNDSDLNIDWGVTNDAIISEKDLILPRFRDIYDVDEVSKNEVKK